MIERKRKELQKKCMSFAKEHKLEFFKNWHIGLCSNIVNYNKDFRCVVHIVGENSEKFQIEYNSFHDFVSKTYYPGPSYISFPHLVLFSFNNFYVEGEEKSNKIEDLYFLEIENIITDIPYKKYTAIQHFEKHYLDILNNCKFSIFLLNGDYKDDFSFVLYMPSFESDIKLIQEIYPGYNHRGEIYFSELESKLLSFYFEIDKISHKKTEEKSLCIDSNILKNIIYSTDKDFKIKTLLNYNNIIPNLPIPKGLNPNSFSEQLKIKEQEIYKYVDSLDISDISKNYKLSIEFWYSRIGGNRDGYDKPNLSIKVSKDTRRDDFISTLLPQFVSIDEYLINNSDNYYEWSKKKEIDNYVYNIQEKIKNKFLGVYSKQQHVSFLLYQFVYNQFNSEYKILNEEIEDSFKLAHLFNWISKYFL